MNLTGFYTLLRREIARFFVVIHQTLTPAIVSAVLYIIIFGYSIGRQIANIDGISYLKFTIPGLIVMNLIISGYSSTSFSLFMGRRFGSIKDLLIAPVSYREIAFAYTISGVVRSMMVGIGILIIGGLLAKISGIHSIFCALFFSIGISSIFSLLGIVAGLAAEEFEDLQVLITFFLTPLTFLGGVFYSIKTLPHLFQKISLFNPVLYMVDGLRYSIIGIHDTNIYIGASIILLSVIILLIVVTYLFRTGWKLRV